MLTRASWRQVLMYLQVLYSYSGCESANYVCQNSSLAGAIYDANCCFQVLAKVRDAPRILKIAAPVAVSIVMLFYILANVAYVRHHDSEATFT